MQALYARFRRLAPSGYLLQQQFQQTMGVMGLTDDHFLVDRMFQVFDTDHDGKLSFIEFASALAIMIRGTEDEKLAFSFKIVGGKEGSGVRLEDFQQLVASYNRMMSSLVAPTGRLTSDEDVKRLFHELAVTRDGTEEEVISLDAYKAAAQENGDFLSCLGLEPMGGRAVPAKKPQKPAPPIPEAPAADGVYVPRQHLEELQRRVLTLQRALAAEQRTSFLGRLPADPPSPVPEEPAQEDSYPWWMPSCGCTPMTRLTQLPCEARGEILDCEPAAPTAAMAATSESAGQEDFLTVQEEQVNALMRLCAKWTDGDRGLNVEAVAPDPFLPPVLQEELRTYSRQRHFSRDQSRESDDSRAFANLNLPHSPHKTSKKSATVNIAGSAASRESDGQGPAIQGRHRALSVTSSRQRRQHRLLGPKKGLAVHFGHENWNMVLSMMIGIRMSVGRSGQELHRELQPVDFIMKEKFSILPRLANIFDATVSKRVKVTRFIDYAPMVFQRIRASFGIHSDDYLRSVGPEQLLGNMVLGNLSSLSELSSEGKSGAFFYYTSDGKYMMKTVTHKEQMLLKKMLKKYYDHITQNQGTLLVRFLGLHCLSVHKNRKGSAVQKVYFVVMGNMFNTPFEIHKRYDLKGSWVGRVTKDEDRDPSVALKDVDFTKAQESILVGPERKAKLVAQIERDSAFLRDNNIIDYSLLLGVYLLGGSAHSADDKGGEHPESCMGLRGATAAAQTIAGINVRMASSDELHGEVPFHQAHMGGMLSSDQKALYFLGIIDILTPYDSRKHLEHWFKALRYDRRGVSCCPPAMYAERFSSFLNNCIS
ncbi:unnamed protein product [Symbiodinium natans]|uniref:Uncharacterized protein n=1 Tax=Symbiodinium natans TaxID=878477 RepID=A0A812S545_9DINO|nr:unnamed protein product [Symbiodinium natans]